MSIIFFFFSRRRRHTRCLSDWSSDVCSSDLVGGAVEVVVAAVPVEDDPVDAPTSHRCGKVRGLPVHGDLVVHPVVRSEERRVGKSVDLGGRRSMKKKKKREFA